MVLTGIAIAYGSSRERIFFCGMAPGVTEVIHVSLRYIVEYKDKIFNGVKSHFYSCLST